jgi:hypothetical protein
MVQAMKSWPVGTKFLKGHDHEPQATAHLEKGWKPGGGPKFPDHQPLGELMSMALQSNPQWDAENGVCEATSSGTSPSPTTKHYVDLRVHPHLRGYKRRKLLQALDSGQEASTKPLVDRSNGGSGTRLAKASMTSPSHNHQASNGNNQETPTNMEEQDQSAMRIQDGSRHQLQWKDQSWQAQSKS